MRTIEADRITFEISESDLYKNYIFIEYDLTCFGWIGYEGLVIDNNDNVEVIGVDEL